MISLQHQKKSDVGNGGSLKTGELFLNEGLISQEDLNMALLIQKKRQQSLSLKKSRFLGMILCDLNLITPMDNYFFLHKYNKFITIHSALISRGMIPKDMVLKTEKESIQQNIPFISLLHKTGLILISELQSLVFDLFHIPYRSISGFVFEGRRMNELTQIIDKHQSYKNKIIPLVLKGNTILFGITDPENILYIKKINDKCPQYRFKIVFISFSGFSRSYKILYADKKSLDLSLLLKFKVSIENPEKENEHIQTLYNCYESLRLLIGNSERNDLKSEFSEFIIQHYKEISQKQRNQTIEFSLEKENKVVKVIASVKGR